MLPEASWAARRDASDLSFVLRDQLARPTRRAITAGRPEFHGIFEDNDPRKRLLAIANYNHDLGELWEFSDTGYVPVDLSNERVQVRRELRRLRDDALRSWVTTRGNETRGT